MQNTEGELLAFVAVLPNTEKCYSFRSCLANLNVVQLLM